VEKINDGEKRELSLSRRLVIGGWIVFHLWLILSALIVIKDLLPYVFDPLVAKITSAKDGQQLLRHFLTNVALVVTYLCTYSPLNWLFMRFSPELTLWEWLSKAIAQIVQQPEDKR